MVFKKNAADVNKELSEKEYSEKEIVIDHYSNQKGVKVLRDTYLQDITKILNWYEIRT